MKKIHLNKAAAITAILAAAPMLTNCGQNLDANSSAIGIQPGTVSAGCLAITGPLPFTANNIQYMPNEGGQILGGSIAQTYNPYGQSYGSIVVGGDIVSGPLVGSGYQGTVAMNVTSTQQGQNTGYGYNTGYNTGYGYGAPTLANAVGTVTLSAATQQQILQAMGSSGYGYNTGYNTGYYPGYGGAYPGYGGAYPGYGGYNTGYAPVGSPIGNVCVSKMSIALTHNGTTLNGIIQIYLNNTNYTQTLQF